MMLNSARLVLGMFLISLIPLPALGNGEKGEVEKEPRPVGNSPKIQYKFGKGLSFTGDDFSLALSAFVQTRFTYNSLEAAADTNTFAVQRGKILLNGHVLNPSWKYGFMANFSTLNGGTAILDDYFIDWVPEKYFGIKVGQYKVPYLMQEVTSDTKGQLVDRSLANGIFTLVRDIGISFHGDLFNDRLAYYFFAMNGDGANTINTNQGLLGGARFEYNILGKYEREESDLEDSEEPNLGFGLAYVLHDSLNSTGTHTEGGTIGVGTRSGLGTFDVGYKYRGWSLNAATMLTRTHEGADLTNLGYHVQGGFFFIPKKLEGSVKGGGAILSNAAINQYEYAAGLNYFIKGQALKLQGDYTLLMNPRGLNLNDHRLRTQLQLIF